MRSRYIKTVPRFIRRPVSRSLAALRWIHRDDTFYSVTERAEFMRRAFMTLAYNGIVGDYAEFGCYGGMTFALAYRSSRRRKYNCKLWAFDSFCGLPPQSVPEDQHPIWREGKMKMSVSDFKETCATKGIPETEYQVVPGFYKDTLTTKTANQPLPGEVALAYVDCDLYSSAQTVLEFLATRIQHGTIMAFDDYFCYSSTALAGERLAAAQFLKANPRFHFSPYWPFGAGGMSFIVEDKSLWKGGECSLLR